MFGYRKNHKDKQEIKQEEITEPQTEQDINNDNEEVVI